MLRRTFTATTFRRSSRIRFQSCCRSILQTQDQTRAWAITAAAVAWTGIIKLIAAPFAGALRRFIPTPASMTVFGAAMYSYLALVLLQRIFDQPLVGIVALAIVAVGVLGRVPITRWRIPPFLVAWLIPLAVALSIGYVHPSWNGVAFTLPFAAIPAPFQAMGLALPFMSVIAPIAIYQTLQDIASVEGAASAGDDYDARAVVACDGLGTLLCGAAGSIVSPVVYALHPPYKAMGARIGFAIWTPVLVLLAISAGLTTVDRAVVSVVDFGGDDRLYRGGSGHGNAASRGSKVPERGAAGVRSARGRGGLFGCQLGAACVEALSCESGSPGRA